MFLLQGTNKESIITFIWLVFDEIIKKISQVLENLGGNPEHRGSGSTPLGGCSDHNRLEASAQHKLRALLTMVHFLVGKWGMQVFFFSPFEFVPEVQKKTVPLSCQ